MKISFGMIVLNGEPFIRYNLENLYPHAHEILIVEGAVEKFKHAATPDGHSIDETVEIIKSFPDPENKIRLIQCKGFWPEKDEMSNAYMENCTGDYIWQVDVDEFYKSEDILKIKEFLFADPYITRVDIKTINFWRGFSAVMQGASYIYGKDEFIRIFKIRSGYRYLRHRPPTLVDEKGKEVIHHKILGARELFEKHGIYIYHYSYVFPEAVKGKSEYYSQLNWGRGHEDGLSWYHHEWESLSNPLRIHIIKYPPSWIVPFTGQHPEVIKKMLRDLDWQENPDIISYLKKPFRKYQKAGEKLADLILKYRDGKLKQYHAIIKVFLNLFHPLTLRNRSANRTIIMVVAKILKDNA